MFILGLSCRVVRKQTSRLSQQVYKHLCEITFSSLLVVYQKWNCWVIAMSWELEDSVLIDVHCQLDWIIMTQESDEFHLWVCCEGISREDELSQKTHSVFRQHCPTAWGTDRIKGGNKPEKHQHALLSAFWSTTSLLCQALPSTVDLYLWL